MQMTEQEKSFIEGCCKADLKTIKTCIKYNVNIHIEDDWCISIVSTNGYSQIVRYLLENGISDSIAAKKGVLRYAIHFRDYELAEYLMARSDEYKADDGAIQWAADNGDLRAVQLLLPYTLCLNWIYCSACKRGHIDLINYLNDNEIYKYDSEIKLALNWAAEGSKWEVIDLLLNESIVDYNTMGDIARAKYEKWKKSVSMD